ncbi:MAG: tyrosine-type recombinase/integrase [Bryobacteraceae bacterium]
MKNKTLTDWIDDYLGYRRGMGFRLPYVEWILREFARFADWHGYRGVLRRQWAEEFAYAPQGVASAYHVRRLAILHDFAKFWNSYEARVEIPPRPLPHPGYRRKVPYIYSDAEVRHLMSIARSLRTTALLIGESQATLIGLMASTGLRTGEAIGFRDQDILWSQGQIHVRESKGRAARVLPVAPSTLTALRKYTSLRNRTFPGHSSGALFVNARGEKWSQIAMSHRFDRLRLASGIAAGPGRRAPRLYDLRHTFACNCLIAWLRAKHDMPRCVHALSLYMGHRHIGETYWYLNAVPAVMELVGRRSETCQFFETGRALR